MRHLILIALLFAPALVEAATLSFSAPTSVPVDTEFPIYVYVNSEKQAFNAVEATIAFPTDKLEVVSVDSTATATILNFWLTLPTFSNKNGTVVFSGGTTRGTIGLDIPVLTIHVRAKGVGDTIITASDVSINASDGQGTNILKEVESLRFNVIPSVNIPAKSSLPTSPEPITEEVTAEEIPEPTLSTTTDEQLSESSVHSGLFAIGSLSYPTINNVTTETSKQGDSFIFISGIAEEGSHVHVLLKRDGVPYKEVTAVVQPDKTWEASLAHIYTYGTYTLSVWSDDETLLKTSQKVFWDPIKLYPPFSIHFFGIIFHWYEIMTASISVLFIILVTSVGIRFFVDKKRFKINTLEIVTGLSFLALTGSIVMHYLLWQQEYTPEEVYWKNTNIKCVSRNHSWLSSFGSAQLSIKVSGVQEEIPTEVGYSQECVAGIHTHDNTGRLHFKINGYNFTLMDFFLVANISFEQSGYTITGTINGEPVDRNTLYTYKLHDTDVIEIEYTKNTIAN